MNVNATALNDKTILFTNKIRHYTTEAYTNFNIMGNIFQGITVSCNLILNCVAHDVSPVDITYLSELKFTKISAHLVL